MTTTSRTLRPSCCPKCQGAGFYFIGGALFPCVHAVRVAVAPPDPPALPHYASVLSRELHEAREHIEALEADLERERARNRELETKLIQSAAASEAEARKARDGALVEAAEVVGRMPCAALSPMATREKACREILALRGRS